MHLDLLKENFLQLEIVARARDVPRGSVLRDLGVTRVKRELFESSLGSACTVLELLGHAPDRAQLAVKSFRQHNLDLFAHMYPHRKDSAKASLTEYAAVSVTKPIRSET